ncbi:hypothetical protein DFH08DRAFT_811483 [Mycena albidolilacea]|uniref:Uncharacterized protein n=1 Tax=Mycena albidolilacea TaxID=1033008 RepID=A0AAD6ZWF7_9AGAR|nr:hypothetical protein DFH08DRAFT_811483 [Mycena albidolilacea]
MFPAVWNGLFGVLEVKVAGGGGRFCEVLPTVNEREQILWQNPLGGMCEGPSNRRTADRCKMLQARVQRTDQITGSALRVREGGKKEEKEARQDSSGAQIIVTYFTSWTNQLATSSYSAAFEQPAILISEFEPGYYKKGLPLEYRPNLFKSLRLEKNVETGCITLNAGAPETEKGEKEKEKWTAMGGNQIDMHEMDDGKKHWKIIGCTRRKNLRTSPMGRSLEKEQAVELKVGLGQLNLGMEVGKVKGNTPL